VGDETVVFRLFVKTKIAQGWTMVAQQDAREALQSISDGYRRALILFGVTLVFVVVVSLLMARGLSRPILNLARIAEQLSKGQFDVTINEVFRKDEIGALARSLERLGASIRYAMERLKKAKSSPGRA
jgi:HAMP domain-containing protein